MSTEVKSRSPLKVPPLRNPGQSLDEELQRLFVDSFLPYFLVASALCGYALIEWMRYYRPQPPSPWFATGVAFIAVIYTAYNVHSLRPKIHALKLGRDGEKFVGQALEELRSGGAIVLHDIMADGFNVDHVVISFKGIFVIETKTRSKPKGRDAKITYDGDKLLIDGRTMVPDPMKQVQANTAWIRDLLMESTGKSYPVRPVLLFPGWYVDSVGVPHPQSKVWVLSPKALSAFINHERTTLSLEDVKMATCHLSRYIRSSR